MFGTLWKFLPNITEPSLHCTEAFFIYCPCQLTYPCARLSTEKVLWLNMIAALYYQRRIPSRITYTQWILCVLPWQLRELLSTLLKYFTPIINTHYNNFVWHGDIKWLWKYFLTDIYQIRCNFIVLLYITTKCSSEFNHKCQRCTHSMTNTTVIHCYKQPITFCKNKDFWCIDSLILSFVILLVCHL